MADTCSDIRLYNFPPPTYTAQSHRRRHEASLTDMFKCTELIPMYCRSCATSSYPESGKAFARFRGCRADRRDLTQEFSKVREQETETKDLPPILEPQLELLVLRLISSLPPPCNVAVTEPPCVDVVSSH